MFFFEHEAASDEFAVGTLRCGGARSGFDNRRDRCSMSDFLVMSCSTRNRLPHLQAQLQPLLAIKDANDLELIACVREQRASRNALHGLAPLNCQMAMCIYMSSREISLERSTYLEDLAKFLDANGLCHMARESRMAELEELAKREDFLMRMGSESQPLHCVTPSSVCSIDVPSKPNETLSEQPTDNEQLAFSTSSPVMGLPSPGDVGMKVA
jgi:hypothetical protein